VTAVTVIAAGLAFLWYVLFGSPDRDIRALEQHLFFVGFCGLLAADAASVSSCFLGAMLHRGENVLGPIAMAAFVTAVFGTLLGGWLGTLVGAVWITFMGFEETALIISAIAGGVVGIGAAIALRLTVLR